jgi:hypothetical protein
VGLLPLLLTSCLDLTVNVTFRTSTAGQVQVDALAWRMAQGIQVVDGADRVPFPASRAEWQAVVDQVNGPGGTGGLSLVSWDGADEDLGFRSKAVIGFTNARALEGLFVVFKQKLTLLQDAQGKWTVTFAPQVPRVTGADPDTRKLWTDLWGQTVWTFAFTPPGQPKAQRTVTLADLAGAQPPAEWTLSW